MLLPMLLAVNTFWQYFWQFSQKYGKMLIMLVMLSFAEKLKELREHADKSQQAVADYVGVSRSTVNAWEHGGDTDNATKAKLATFFGISLAEMLGLAGGSGQLPAPQLEHVMPGPQVSLPVYEEVAAGQACFAREAPVEYQTVDYHRVKHDLDNYILVRVAGDSMIGRGIMPGGLVLVHRQDSIDDGQTAVVAFPDGTVTMKRVRFANGGKVILIPANPARDEQIVDLSDIRICGRVVRAITDIE
jgi:SOS-response transcriptional repressor LexA